MKKVFIICSSILIFAACNSSSTDNKDGDTKSADTTAATPAAEASDPEVTKGLDLVAKSDCFTCHKLTETSIGPAYSAVAAKYKSVEPAAAIDSMVHQIINGGSGKWGNVPMTPHPAISKDDAKSMAHYIMSIK